MRKRYFQRQQRSASIQHMIETTYQARFQLHFSNIVTALRHLIHSYRCSSCSSRCSSRVDALPGGGSGRSSSSSSSEPPDWSSLLLPFPPLGAPQWLLMLFPRPPPPPAPLLLLWPRLWFPLPFAVGVAAEAGRPFVAGPEVPRPRLPVAPPLVFARLLPLPLDAGPVLPLVLLPFPPVVDPYFWPLA